MTVAGPTGAILPILQRMQADIGDPKRDMAALRTSFDAQNEKSREMNGYLSFNLGVTSRQTFEIDDLRKEGEAVKTRLRALEAQP